MKYLRKFNENKDNLEEFVELNLTYLTDDGFDIKFIGERDIEEIAIYKLGQASIDKEDNFYWSEISDRFIPFIYQLEKNYGFIQIHFYFKGSGQRIFRSGSSILKNLLSGNYPITNHHDPKQEEPIRSIYIYL